MPLLHHMSLWQQQASEKWLEREVARDDVLVVGMSRVSVSKAHWRLEMVHIGQGIMSQSTRLGRVYVGCRVAMDCEGGSAITRMKILARRMNEHDLTKINKSKLFAFNSQDLLALLSLNMLSLSARSNAGCTMSVVFFPTKERRTKYCRM